MWWWQSRISSFIVGALYFACGWSGAAAGKKGVVRWWWWRWESGMPYNVTRMIDSTPRGVALLAFHLIMLSPVCAIVEGWAI